MIVVIEDVQGPRLEMLEVGGSHFTLTLTHNRDKPGKDMAIPPESGIEATSQG